VPGDLTGLAPDIEETLRAIEAAVAGMTPEQLVRAPAGRWSAESVLEHLDLTFSGTVVGLRKRLETGVRALTADWKQRIATWLIVDLGFFPPGFKAPEFANPGGGKGGSVLDDIRRHLREMDEVMVECDQKLGAHVAFKHPRLGPLTTAQWRKFHLVHTRHHMKQIARLRAP